MATFKFYYDGGKTTDILTRNYSLNKIGVKTLIIDGEENKFLKSKVDFKDIDGKVKVNFNGNFDNIDIKYKHIFVDNCHLLKKTDIFKLYKHSKLNDINISLYGNREKNGIRCMELADDIIKLNDFEFLRKGCGLTFYYGTMNSGKTIKLIGNLEYLNDEYNVALLKPLTDRNELYIYTRLGLKVKADYIINKETKILSLIDEMLRNHINIIMIDEAQFLTSKQIKQLKKITEEYKIPVLCYGLKTDFQTNSFEGSKELLKIADSLIKIQGQCACCINESNFNARKINNMYINEGEQVEIDGVDFTYDSLCPNCYLEKVLKYKK